MRPRNLTPSYTRHQSGRARVRWTDAAGVRHERLMPGPFDSTESRAAYARLQLELTVAPHRVTTERTGPDGVSVNELCEAFAAHAELYYRTKVGTTGEVREHRIVIRHLRELYGMRPALGFGPLALKAVRQRLVDAGNCRGVVNQRTRRIVRMFKWGVSEELVPPAAYQALKAVCGLQANRTEARETQRVMPVPAADVDTTLSFLNRTVRAMVELQHLTGMRPGEVCRVRLCEINRTGEVWTYRPAHHKTKHHGKERIVMIGPKGRAVIESFVAGGTVVDPSAPLFSPRRMRCERFAEMRAARKTSVQPSQANRSNRCPVRPVGELFTPRLYSCIIRRAAIRAGVAPWHPNQLRHAFATVVRREHGLEAAQVLLGHSRADVTQIYAERNADLASSVAARLG